MIFAEVDISSRLLDLGLAALLLAGVLAWYFKIKVPADAERDAKAMNALIDELNKKDVRLAAKDAQIARRDEQIDKLHGMILTILEGEKKTRHDDRNANHKVMQEMEMSTHQEIREAVQDILSKTCKYKGEI